LSDELESIAYMDAEPATKAATKVSLKPTATIAAKPTIAAKATKKVTAKSCPVGKEINLKTGRCIKQCASNETRNAQGRCVKQTKRIRSSSQRSSSSSRSRSRNIKEDLLNQIFPELKRITPFTKVTDQKLEEKEANPTIKINKTFPYENRSKSKS
jgi:hypothetical protein